MNILAIETSCDETALCVLEASGGFSRPKLAVHGEALLSQIDVHQEYGGVYPNLAKREHAKNLIPLLRQALEEANMLAPASTPSITKEKAEGIRTMLEREPELFVHLASFITSVEKPNIDAISVTVGPGLEPALWVGVNLAKALSLLWEIPVIPVNHMEGHIFSALLKRSRIDADKTKSITYSLQPPTFPLLALLVSGGHTDLVLMKDWHQYQYVGATRDDAVGEAFDKVARMLGLPYPGGPQISALAEISRMSADKGADERRFQLPRPMLNSGDLDFSFSGIKTAVLYTLKNIGTPSEMQKRQIAREFENAVVDVLVEKSVVAIEKCGAKTFALGGGVSANKHLRAQMGNRIATQFPNVSLCIAPTHLTTDNAVMIAAAGYFRSLDKKDRQKPADIAAAGNLSLS